MEKAEEDFYDYLDALGEDAVLAKEQQTELKANYTAYISAVEKFTGKKMDEIVAIVAEKLVTEQMAAEAETTNPTTTVTTYTVGMTDASDKAARWALNKATGKDCLLYTSPAGRTPSLSAPRRCSPRSGWPRPDRRSPRR